MLEKRRDFEKLRGVSIKHIHISNISEDVWDYISEIKDKEERLAEIHENALLADRDLISTLSFDEVLIISPYLINERFIGYIKDLLSKNGIYTLHTKNHTGRISADIVSDEELLEFLKNLGRKNIIRITSYAASKDFFHLLELLRKAGGKFIADENPEPDKLWTTGYFGSKTGIRETMAKLETPIAMCEGKVVQSSESAVEEGLCFHKLYGGVVFKIKKGHAGAGVKIIPPESMPNDGRLRDYILSELSSVNMLSNVPMCVERYLPIDTEIAGGNPSLEYKINSDGSFEFLYPCAMRVTKEGVFKGIEIGTGLIEPSLLEKLVATGNVLAKHFSLSGYRGFFDVDCIVCKDGETYLSECNLRRTGGTHVFVLGRYLFGKKFQDSKYLLAHNLYDIPAEKRLSFDELVSLLSNLLYRSETGEGVVITSVGILERSQFGYIVAANTREAALEIETNMERLLSEATN